MSAILKVARFELQNLLCKKLLWIITSAYAIFTLGICLVPDLRQSYFSAVESVPIMLFDFIAPVFLAAILISTLSPVFAGDKENHVNQIPAACLTGKKGWSIAKMLAAILLSVFACLLIAVITLAISSLCNLFDGNLKVKYIGAELEFSTIWSTWQHFRLSFICLADACIILALFVLFISSITKTTIAAVSISSIFTLFEVLFNEFSFPTVLQEYNIWVLFKPYYLFVLNIFNISPYMNLLLLSIAFSPLCIFAIWQIIKKGA